VASAAAIVGITVASFALTAGGLAASLSAWWTNLTQFQGGTGDVRLPAPANISTARSVVGLAQWVDSLPGPLGSIGDWLGSAVYRYPLVPTAVLTVVTAVVFILCRRSIPGSVVVVVPLAIAATASTASPAYYLIFALVVAAVVMGAVVVGARLPGLLDGRGDSTPGSGAGRWSSRSRCRSPHSPLHATHCPMIRCREAESSSRTSVRPGSLWC